MERSFMSNLSSSDWVSVCIPSDATTSSGTIYLGSSDSPVSAGGFRQNVPENMPYNASVLRSTMKAAVHINVGGVAYTSSLETLTHYPESRLGKIFSGTIPFVLNSLNQKFFIDRDGGMFRHILNFLRNQRLLLPDDFPYLDLLLTEAEFFELHDMVYFIKLLKRQRERGNESRECPSIDEETYDNESQEHSCDSLSYFSIYGGR